MQNKHLFALMQLRRLTSSLITTIIQKHVLSKKMLSHSHSQLRQKYPAPHDPTINRYSCHARTRWGYMGPAKARHAMQYFFTKYILITFILNKVVPLLINSRI